MSRIDQWYLRAAGSWILWAVMLALSTVTLVGVRGEIEQSHAALTLLLVVLGGSAGGGRPLGYSLALSGFVVIDYFFQAPYGSLAVGKTLDWVVLVAFLASAFVATELLARARGEAETARKRTEEVASLSRLGSETLRHARADDALEALSALIRSTFSARWCTIRELPDSKNARRWTSAIAAEDPRVTGRMRELEERMTLAASADAVADVHRVALATSDGSVVIDSLVGEDASSRIEAFGLPLFVESRLAGMLIVGGSTQQPIAFAPPRRRFVATISYYAALGLERVRLAREAQDARELREANRAKDEVLATVSHDLRTPLTTIKLLAQAAAARGEAAGASIEEQVDRLADLVTNVLDLSRIRAGGVPLDVALNTAEDVIAAAVSRVQGVLRGRHIVTKVDLDQPALVARFDFVQTLRILVNLIDNALRYAPEDGSVEINAERNGAWVAITVADRGPGVRPEERSRIFDAFYRPRSEVPDAGRAGLGLSIARRLAELQEGTVEYSPRDGGGSLFTLRLPAVDLNSEKFIESAILEAFGT
jgi:two-component system, OmpR family, sensor histidine kinase KdpD